MAESPEVDLFAAARGGQPDAWEELCARHVPRLHTLVRVRLGPSLRAHLESRDVVQETLLKAVRHMSGFAGTTHREFGVWLARIAENEIRDQADRFGRGRRRPPGAVVALDETPSREVVARVRSETSRLDWDARRARLVDALESLAPEHREVIVLRKLEELSFADVGQRLGRSADACRMLLGRALAALTLSLGDAE